LNNAVIPAIMGMILAPLAGGLLRGIDRKLTARMQARIGPSVLQPFFDVGKLIAKEQLIVNAWQVFCAILFMISAAISVTLFFMASDLLLILFVHGVSSVFLVIGALSAHSPYSHIGAHRELLQVLTYKPLLVLVVLGIYLETGSFRISAVYSGDHAILLKLPVLFLVLGCAMAIELRKSPFDISASHHAHQEIVQGVFTEYSGPCLAAIEIGHWYETALLLCFCSLFWTNSLVGKTILVGTVFFLQVLIDNVTARLTWRWMLTYALGMGLILAVLNLIWLYGSL
jgi:ech hydrogenase subunit B